MKTPEVSGKLTFPISLKQDREPGHPPATEVGTHLNTVYYIRFLHSGLILDRDNVRQQRHHQ